MSTFRYKAFISYNHLDTGWAKWLLQSLELYRLPGVKTRGVGKVFRDRDESGAATDLREEIQNVLAASEHLIVVASPNSARSKYVEAEIQAFALSNAQREKPGKILTLIVAGEPNATDSDPAIECFPPSLRGSLYKPNGAPLEPLAADARRVGDGRTRALAKLVSGLMEIPYDTLVRRDLRRQQQQRIAMGAAALLALIIAGTVTTVIVNGNMNRQQLELKVAQQAILQAQIDAERQAAERSFQAVTAVNNAERARRELAGGNAEAAIDLALGSLPNDGSLPFIPQAYNVLYSAMVQRGEPVALDIGSTADERAATFFTDDGMYFTSDTYGAVAVWSPAEGVTFRRSDSNNDFTSMSPDRSTVFLRAYPDILRYTASTKTWDTINDTKALSLDDPNVEPFSNPPTKYVAVNRTTLAGCSDDLLVVLRLPKRGGGDATSLWTKKYPSTCVVSEATANGTIIVGDWDGAVEEVEIGSQKVIAHFSTEGTFTPEWSRTAGDVLAVGFIGQTQVFRRSDSKLLLSVESSTEPEILSPTGSHVIEPPDHLAKHGLLAHNLETGASISLDCENCSVIGFADTTTVLLLGSDDRGVDAFDVTTGTHKESVLVFPERVDQVSFDPAAGMLLGMRSLSTAIVVTLGKKSNNTIAAPRPNYRLGSAIYAGANSIISAVSNLSGGFPYPTQLHLYRATPGGGEIIHADLNSLSLEYAELARHEHGIFSVFQPDPIFAKQGPYRLFDAKSGALVLNRTLQSRPVSFGGGRYLLLPENGDFGVFDLIDRIYKPVGAKAGAELASVWSTSGDFLTVADKSDIQLYKLTGGGVKLEQEFPAETYLAQICVTSDGAYIYGLDLSKDSPVLMRFSVATGQVDHSVTPQYEGDDNLSLVLINAFTTLGSGRDAPLLCDGEKLVMRDEIDELAATWTLSRQTVETGVLEDVDPKPAVSDVALPFDAVEYDTSTYQTAVMSATDAALILRTSDTDEPLVGISTEGARIASSGWVAAKQLMAAGLDNGRLQVWDAKTPSAPMIDLAAHGAPVSYLDVRPDAEMLLTADETGEIKVWPLASTENLIAAFADSF